MSAMTPEHFDDDDHGRVVAIASATPGWWAEHRPKEGKPFRVPVAAWVLHEVTIRRDSSGLLQRYSVVQGVDPTGEGWAGETIEDGSHPHEVVYVYDPEYRP